MDKDLWCELETEAGNLHDAINLVDAMSDAASMGDIDPERFSSALCAVWNHLYDVEERLFCLFEALEKRYKNVSGAASNEAKSRASAQTSASGTRGRQYRQGAPDGLEHKPPATKGVFPSTEV